MQTARNTEILLRLNEEACLSTGAIFFVRQCDPDWTRIFGAGRLISHTKQGWLTSGMRAAARYVQPRRQVPLMPMPAISSLFNRRAYGSENLRPMPKNIGGCAAAEIDFILISDSQFQ
jgi:hypothetical protein